MLAKNTYAKMIETMTREKQLAQQGTAEQCKEVYSCVTSQEPDTLVSHAVFPGHRLTVDEPITFGGTDTAPNPLEMIMAGLGASLEVTTRAYSLLLDIPVDNITVKMTAVADFRGFYGVGNTRAGFTTLNVDVYFNSSCDDEDITVLLAHVERCCPALDVIRGSSNTKINMQRKD
jgi:putative redox protein